MNCGSCGTQNEEDSTFCLECGASIQKEKNNSGRLKRGMGIDAVFQKPKRSPSNFIDELEQKDRDDFLLALTEEINEFLKTNDIHGGELKNFKVKKSKKITFKAEKPSYNRHPAHKLMIEFEVVNTDIVTVYR